jgi:predicted DNA-binding helix-hairpin-helix protein
MGVVLKKAQYFITCNELPVNTIQETSPEYVRKVLTAKKQGKKAVNPNQLTIVFPD